MDSRKVAVFNIIMDEQQFQNLKVALMMLFMNEYENLTSDERDGIEEIMEQISDYKKGTWDELRNAS